MSIALATRSTPLRRTGAFVLSFGLASVATLLAMRAVARHAGGSVRLPHGAFVGDYDGDSTAHGVFKWELGAAGEFVDQADVLLYSSSKGMYGYKARLLNGLMGPSDHPIRFYNLSLGYGEGAPFLLDIIENRDIRHRVLIFDVTDNTNDYHYSAAADNENGRDRLQSFYHYLSVSSRFYADNALMAIVPKFRTAPPDANFWPPRLQPYNLRDTSSGDVVTQQRTGAHAIIPGVFKAAFDPSGWLRTVFVPACARRDIVVILTLIPYGSKEGAVLPYDPDHLARAARMLGRPYAPVDWTGLKTVDGVHMDALSAGLFSFRLAGALRRPEVDVPGLVAAERRARRVR